MERKVLQLLYFQAVEPGACSSTGAKRRASVTWVLALALALGTMGQYMHMRRHAPYRSGGKDHPATATAAVTSVRPNVETTQCNHK